MFSVTSLLALFVNCLQFLSGIPCFLVEQNLDDNVAISFKVETNPVVCFYEILLVSSMVARCWSNRDKITTAFLLDLPGPHNT